jgi:UTP--glucose-1-phosphate uridylyltransferase
MIEKPAQKEAPSRLAVIGRYILPASIFSILEKTQPGKNQEIQLTDALRTLAQSAPMHACLVNGIRHDAGDKLGFLKATVEFALKNPDFGEHFAHYLKGLNF